MMLLACLDVVFSILPLCEEHGGLSRLAKAGVVVERLGFHIKHILLLVLWYNLFDGRDLGYKKKQMFVCYLKL